MSQWLFPTTRWAIYLRDGLCCTYCLISLRELMEERDGNFLTVDHCKPRSKGGSNHPTNLVTCCYSCNAAKGAKTLARHCRDSATNYDAVRGRCRTRRKRDVGGHREAARVLLGKVEGVTIAQMVIDHDWLVKSQWGDSIDTKYWEHLQSQKGMFCDSCTAPLGADGRYIEPPPF